MSNSLENHNFKIGVTFWEKLSFSCQLSLVQILCFSSALRHSHSLNHNGLSLMRETDSKIWLEPKPEQFTKLQFLTKLTKTTILPNCQVPWLSCITLELFTHKAFWLRTQNQSACEMEKTKIWTLDSTHNSRLQNNFWKIILKEFPF